MERILNNTYTDISEVINDLYNRQQTIITNEPVPIQRSSSTVPTVDSLMLQTLSDNVLPTIT